MKILHLNQFGTPAGGVEGYIADVSRALSKAGHETRLVSFAPEAATDLIPGTVQVVKPDLAAKLSGIKWTIADFGPDAAYIHAVHEPEVIQWVASQLPVIAYVHSPYLVCPGFALYLRRSFRVCRRTVGLGCITNAQIERCCFGRNPIHHIRRLKQVRSLLGVSSMTNILVGSNFMRDQLVANGLQPDKVSILAPYFYSGLIPSYAPPLNSHTILFSGRLTEEKGLRQLLEAIAPLGADFQLIVAGDGPERTACEQLTTQLGISERVLFTGWVGQDQMDQLYRRCAFVVMPSLWPEPYGRIGPEAFVRGRPVIAFEVGGIPDWLEDAETGYLAAPGDVGGLRAAIARLLDNPLDQERMGTTALKRARMRWDAESHVRRLTEALEAAIRGFHGGAQHSHRTASTGRPLQDHRLTIQK